jgi:hypothetical protein
MKVIAPMLSPHWQDDRGGIGIFGNATEEIAGKDCDWGWPGAAVQTKFVAATRN